MDLSRLVILDFKVESIQSNALIIVESLWGCTIDMKDSSFHVPISWLFHCYLAIILDDRVLFYYFLFGLALASWPFNRLSCHSPFNPFKSVYFQSFHPFKKGFLIGFTKDFLDNSYLYRSLKYFFNYDIMNILCKNLFFNLKI